MTATLRSYLRAPLLASAVALAAVGCADEPTASGNRAVPLTSGEAVTISGSAGSQRLYRIDVPAGTGTLHVRMSGGGGDADLIIRRDAAPGPGVFDCVSDQSGNEEECLIQVPGAGTWYILVLGFQSYSNLRLFATVGGELTATPLESGVAVSNLSGAAGSFQMFQITVPSGATSLDVTLDGPTGDADLYVRRNTFPRLNINDYFSAGETSVERTFIAGPGGGIWYIRVDGFTAYEGLTLVATVTVP